MKVAVFSESLWPLGEGGAELATYLYARLLAELGVRVRVYVRRGGARWEGLDVAELGGAGTRKFHAPPLGARRALEWCDVAYFASAYWELVPLAKRMGRRAVVHLHSYDPACPVGTLYNARGGSVCRPETRSCWGCIHLQERWLGRPLWRAVASQVLNGLFNPLFAEAVRRADALVFVSEAQRRLFAEHFGDVPRSHVVYNPAPPLQYLPPGGRAVGYFGGLSPWKGVYVLLRAWARLGGGARLYMTRASALRSRPPGVVALGDLTPWELEEVHRSVSVVAVPSLWWEPFGYAALEGLVRGRVVVASDVGGLPEVVGGAPGARLVPPGDADALAEALEWALAADAAELGARNREYALRRFDGVRLAERLLKVLEG
ncbi:glycosyltransferase [Pyrobaculum neutrophilum]|uniref:Glycosyl transferase group 1 n=1 Tax=Pyrobaculum neutrophilum (strain DSM 2338 / JCM 9278 / NBRC 100436 / V24Sta) TaxID=444157 RepID=B1YC93_PYRNV|nr:glycosyltransferase [Pyrobaculum neutrophilum]ACB39406.1 glycosyl transferase group 1 [Pyrobaculum neutrophilum V24Sta]